MPEEIQLHRSTREIEIGPQERLKGNLLPVGSVLICIGSFNTIGSEIEQVSIRILLLRSPWDNKIHGLTGHLDQLLHCCTGGIEDDPEIP